MWVLVPAEPIEFRHGDGVTCDCEPPNTGAVNRTQILWKSTTPSQLLSHLSSPESSTSVARSLVSGWWINLCNFCTVPFAPGELKTLQFKFYAKHTQQSITPGDWLTIRRPWKHEDGSCVSTDLNATVSSQIANALGRQPQIRSLLIPGLQSRESWEVVKSTWPTNCRAQCSQQRIVICKERKLQNRRHLQWTT